MKKEFKIARRAKEELLKLLRQNLHIDRDSVRYDEVGGFFTFFIRQNKNQFFNIEYKLLDSGFEFKLKDNNSKTPINILIEKKLKEWCCFKYIKSKIKEMSLVDLYNYLYEKFPVLELELEDNILYVDKKFQIYKNKESEFIIIGYSYDFYHRVPSFDVNLDRITRLFEVEELSWGCLGSVEIVGFLNKCKDTEIDKDKTTLLNILNNGRGCIMIGYDSQEELDYYKSVLSSDLNKVYEFSHHGSLSFNYKGYTLSVKLIVPKNIYDKYQDYQFMEPDFDLFNEIYLQFVYYKPDDFDSHEIEVISFKDFKSYDSIGVLNTVYDKILGKVKSIAKLKN